VVLSQAIPPLVPITAAELNLQPVGELPTLPPIPPIPASKDA
jgi:hypothetical protein